MQRVLWTSLQVLRFLPAGHARWLSLAAMFAASCSACDQGVRYISAAVAALRSAGGADGRGGSQRAHPDAEAEAQEERRSRAG
jgi:hypothetical protein